jgi:hypothetical protein
MSSIGVYTDFDAGFLSGDEERTPRIRRNTQVSDEEA